MTQKYQMIERWRKYFNDLLNKKVAQVNTARVKLGKQEELCQMIGDCPC